jgi:hypothetical protein
MPNTKHKIKRASVFVEDEHFIVADNDAVLTKMLQVGATLDLDTYCQFAMIHPDSLDAEGLAQIPDVILANTKWVQ